MAAKSYQLSEWVDLCDDRYVPHDIDEMIKVSSQSKGDPHNVNVMPCPTCVRIEGNGRIRELRDQLRVWHESESQYRSNEQELSNAIELASRTLHGNARARELFDLGERRKIMVSKLGKILRDMEYLKVEYAEIARQIGINSDDGLLETALDELNSRLKIYFGDPDEVEKAEEPEDYPTHVCDIDEKNHPFKIFDYGNEPDEGRDEDGKNDDDDREDEEDD